MPSPTSPLEFRMVRAGAGAGKTTGLVDRVLQVLAHAAENKQPLPTMVVCTFTIKATQELKQRLLKEAIRRKQLYVVHYLNDSTQIQISTIHSILNHFLKRFAHQFGIDANYQFLSPYEEEKCAKQVLKKILFSQDKYQTLLEIYSFQELATYCEKFYAQSMETEGLRPQNREQLLKSSSDFFASYKVRGQEAADTLKKALDQYSGKSKSIEAWKQVANFFRTIAVHTQDRHLLLQAREKITRKPANMKDFLTDEENFFITEFWEDLKEAINSPFWDSAFIEKTAEVQTIFHELAEQFSQDFFAAKIEMGKLSLTDLELWSYHFLQKYPEVGKDFSGLWQYWLIDEYQDTSPLQEKILSQLIQRTEKYIVGDPQQSIYYFRGAEKDLYDQMWAQYQSIGHSIETKTINYRSNPSLIHFINDFFHSKNFSAMEPKADTVHTEPVAWLYPLASKQEQEEQVVRWIQKLSQDCPLEKICILVRKHDQIKDIMLVLQKNQIPFQVHIGSSFYSRREVRDLVFLLQFLLNPHDDENLLQVLRSPYFYVPDAYLAQTFGDQKKFLWRHYLENIKQQPESIQSLAKYLEESKDLGYWIVFQKILQERDYLWSSFYFDSSGKWEANIWKFIYLLKDEMQRPGFQIFSFLKKIQMEAIEMESLEEAEGASAFTPSRVQIMTIHKSKGLEFKYVLLPYLDKKPDPARGLDFAYCSNEKSYSIPVLFEETMTKKHLFLGESLTAIKKQKEEEERDRVLYVAVTRAEEAVFFFWTNPAEKNSWGAYIEERFSEPGLHANEKYTFAVGQILEAKEWGSINPLQKEVFRKPLEIPTLGQKPRLSVSYVLEQKYNNNVKKLSYQASPIEKLKIAEQGEIFHSFFENYFYHLETQSESWTNDMRESIQYLENLVAPPWHVLLQNAYVEWGFSYDFDHYVLDGKIDLWGLADGEIWIIDYKTGSSRFKEKAFEQLQIYSLAVREFQGLETARLAVIYPFEKKVYLEDAKPKPELRANYNILF